MKNASSLAIKISITVTCLVSVAGCNRTDIDAANQSAAEFIRHVPNATGVTCADQDSDGDGYVTCTVFRGSEDPMTIQCGSERFCLNCARGCKFVPFYGGSKKKAD